MSVDKKEQQKQQIFVELGLEGLDLFLLSIFTKVQTTNNKQTIKPNRNDVDNESTI